MTYIVKKNNIHCGHKHRSITGAIRCQYNSGVGAIIFKDNIQCDISCWKDELEMVREYLNENNMSMTLEEILLKRERIR
jgi:hypothetical protein